MQNIQLYTEKVITEADSSSGMVVTLINVDLSELASQINIDDMLYNYDMADVYDYIERKRQEDME